MAYFYTLFQKQFSQADSVRNTISIKGITKGSIEHEKGKSYRTWINELNIWTGRAGLTLEGIRYYTGGYPNLYLDLTWIPILLYTASNRVLHQLIEMAQIDKICWGCDTWTLEESYGSLLAFYFSRQSGLRRTSLLKIDFYNLLHFSIKKNILHSLTT